MFLQNDWNIIWPWKNKN